MCALYTKKFYGTQVDDSLASARSAVPLIQGLLRPTSVLDVGCGVGTWLRAWQDLGVHDLAGLDGDYVDRSALLVPPSNFRPTDLSKPFSLGRRFDLVQSLEVAEHLPEQAAAQFVESICRHTDTVVFSAAIPGQPGLGHVNLQWQSYWAALFKEHGFAHDVRLRNLIWGQESIAAYYRQNVMLLRRGAECVDSDAPTDVVHPAVYGERVLVPLRRVVELRMRSLNVRSRLRAVK